MSVFELKLGILSKIQGREFVYPTSSAAAVCLFIPELHESFLHDQWVRGRL